MQSPSKQPVEILTAELRGCCNGYIGAPALAAQLVSALRVAGYIIVPKGAIGRAQDDAVREYKESQQHVRLAELAEARYGTPSEFPLAA